MERATSTRTVTEDQIYSSCATTTRRSHGERARHYFHLHIRVRLFFLILDHVLPK